MVGVVFFYQKGRFPKNTKYKRFTFAFVFDLQEHSKFYFVAVRESLFCLQHMGAHVSKLGQTWRVKICPSQLHKFKPLKT